MGLLLQGEWCKLNSPASKSYPLVKTPTKWGPQTIAKLVYNSNVTMVYGTQITIVIGAYKPANITGGPHFVAMESPIEFDDMMICRTQKLVIFQLA